MKQILLRKGKVSVEDVPAPAKHPKQILIEVTRSLISTGTEISSLQLSGDSLLDKARKKPEAVKKVLQSVRVRGIMKTFELVQQELDSSKPLGYSCAGRVIAVGDEVKDFVAGDRVACAGALLANHAEVVSVPANLTVRIPTGVSDQSASFVTIGSIALQGVRRADVRLGETVCVIGLGLIGQITVQLLVAAGCQVFGVDLDPTRVEKAKGFGLKDGSTSLDEIRKKIEIVTNGHGADATLLTASTASSDPTRYAFELTRKKGRIVVVGAVGMDLARSPFYEKEQDFLISCSYGPGRYDSSYEMDGQDYPYAYVRWTENRNMVSFLDLIRAGKVNVQSLVDLEIPFQKSEEAYQRLQSGEDKPLAVVLTYEEAPSSLGVKSAPIVKGPYVPVNPGKVKLGLIGIGNFAKSTHLPSIRELHEKISVTGVCTAHGASSQSMGRQLKASVITTEATALIKDPLIDAVLVSTRHDTHASIAQAALSSGKHIYLEKPMVLHQSELEALDKTIRGLGTVPVFMVGFNRRYSPLGLQLRDAVNNRQSPIQALYRVSPGLLPQGHWVYSTEGGGRLRGEACHMIDFFRFLVQSPLKAIQVEALYPTSSVHRPDENFAANFSYEDGSLCTLVYTVLGNEALPKERIEVSWDGNSAVLDDFKSLQFYGRDGSTSGRQDKGHLAALETFVTSIKSGISFPIPWEQLFETTQATIQLDAEVWGRIT